MESIDQLEKQQQLQTLQSHQINLQAKVPLLTNLLKRFSQYFRFDYDKKFQLSTKLTISNIEKYRIKI